MQPPKKEESRFESIKQGLLEAIAWKQGQKTGAVLHTYLVKDISKILKK